jgi:hypothetical protein
MINKLIEFLPIIPCREATRLISQAMERKLTWRESIQLKLHLAVCELCQMFAKQIRGLHELLGSYHPQEEERLSPESKAQLKEKLKSH